MYLVYCILYVPLVEFMYLVYCILDVPLGEFMYLVFCILDIPLVEFMYLVCTCMPRESYCRRLRSLLCFCYVFRALINSHCLLILSVLLVLVSHWGFCSRVGVLANRS